MRTAVAVAGPYPPSIAVWISWRPSHSCTARTVLPFAPCSMGLSMVIGSIDASRSFRRQLAFPRGGRNAESVTGSVGFLSLAAPGNLAFFYLAKDNARVEESA